MVIYIQNAVFYYLSIFPALHRSPDHIICSQRFNKLLKIFEKCAKDRGVRLLLLLKKGAIVSTVWVGDEDEKMTEIGKLKIIKRG